jgi:hypothetical protein
LFIQMVLFFILFEHGSQYLNLIKCTQLRFA